MSASQAEAVETSYSPLKTWFLGDFELLNVISISDPRCCSDTQDFGCSGCIDFSFYYQTFLLCDLLTGGYLLYAWEYMANHGLASEKCIPYASGSGHAPTCPSTCDDNSTITRTPASLSSVAYSGNTTQLQIEIMKNGPIQVSTSSLSRSSLLFLFMFAFTWNFSGWIRRLQRLFQVFMILGFQALFRTSFPLFVVIQLIFAVCCAQVFCLEILPSLPSFTVTPVACMFHHQVLSSLEDTA